MSVKSIKLALLFNSVEHLLVYTALIECSTHPRTLTEGLKASYIKRYQALRSTFGTLRVQSTPKLINETRDQ
jgi:hypothetical protein